MRSRAARLAAVILLGIAAVEIVQGDRFSLLLAFAGDRVTADGAGAASSDRDDCFSCAASEGAAPRASLAAPLFTGDWMLSNIGGAQSVCSPAPYHPPR